MLNRFVLCAVLFGALSCASKEQARVPPATSIARETADERLEPLSCASIKAALPDSFANALDLRFSPAMLDASQDGWSQDDIVALARMLVVKPGILTRVWNYYGPGSGSITGFPFSFTSRGKTYARIRVDVYAQEDCCRNKCGGSGCPGSWPDSCREGDWVECGGFGVYRGGNWFMVGGNLCPEPTPRRPVVVAGGTMAHEMAHLCHFVRDPYADSGFSELLATGAEYLTGERWQEPVLNPRSSEYDVSLKSGNQNNLRCVGSEAICKYNQYRLWNAYLFTHFPGAADSLDLVYRWIHHGRPSWGGLGQVLLQEPFQSQIPGGSAGEKLGTLYQRFAMARYMDAPGDYGFGPEVSPRAMHFFEWPDTAALIRARAIPPTVRLGQTASRTYTSWRDPVQPWGGDEPCRVLTTGTDYWIALATPGRERTLNVRIRGRQPVPENQTFRLGYVTYADADSMLCRKPPLEVVENVIEAAAIRDSLDVRLNVPHFGGTAKSVLLVLSMVEKEPTLSFWGVQSFDYEITFATR
jgi:hypothetical protein